eukprot:3553533-Pleurochrysis_carterae.AAC.1
MPVLCETTSGCIDGRALVQVGACACALACSCSASLFLLSNISVTQLRLFATFAYLDLPNLTPFYPADFPAACAALEVSGLALRVQAGHTEAHVPVSYTHLTLPTILLV